MRGAGARRTIEEKGFNRLEKFSRGEQEFVDWAYDFKTILGTQCYQLKVLLDVVEKEKAVSNADALYTKFKEQMMKVEEVRNSNKFVIKTFSVREREIMLGLPAGYVSEPGKYNQFLFGFAIRSFLWQRTLIIESFAKK